MPPVIDISNHAPVEAQTLERERSQFCGARPRVWRFLTHRITTYLTPTPRAKHASSCRPFESPMDRLAQEHASLSLLALAII